MDRVEELAAEINMLRRRCAALDFIVGDLEATEEKLLAHIAELQQIIDSRPALNAGLVSAYTKWTHMIYAKEMQHIIRARKDH